MTTAEMSPAQAEAELILIKMMQDAQTADDPSPLTGGELADIPAGEGTVSAPMVVSSKAGNGYAVVYHTVERDGPRVINRHMLAATLKKKLADGSPAFTVYDTGLDAKAVGLMCPLHPGHERRAWIESIGINTFCNSGDPSKRNRDDLRTILDVRRHMKSKHRGAMEAIAEAEAAEREAEEAQLRAEERAERRAIMERLAPSAEAKVLREACAECGDDIPMSGIGRTSHMRKHK